MTLFALQTQIAAILRAADVSDADFEAKQLLGAVLGLDTTSYLLSRFDAVLDADIEKALSLANRRAAGEPLQYLIGSWTFLDETFFIGPGVLIPRPETEMLTLKCEALLKEKTAPVVYDLCAGSGCIGLSLQKRCSEARVYLVERYDDALRYLRQNAEKIADPARMMILQGDVLSGATAFPSLPPADLIVSNPPYIPTGELPTLQREVQKEPRTALDGGDDGLLFYRCFAEQWRSALKEDGLFAFECGEGQGQAIAALFAQHGMISEIQYDLKGLDRFVFIRQRGRENA